MNKKDFAAYFARPVLQMLLKQPLNAANRADQYDVTAGPYDLWPVLGDVLLCGEGEVE